MTKVSISFLLGAALGAAAYWYVDQHRFQLWQKKSEVVGTVESAASNVTEEISRAGSAIQEKAKKALDDAQLTAAIKTKLIAEPGLPALKINVDTRDGLVTLSGTVDSSNQITRAVNIALQTEGVRKVASLLQVTPAR
jgi:hyperosmotically inducible protein